MARCPLGGRKDKVTPRDAGKQRQGGGFGDGVVGRSRAGVRKLQVHVVIPGWLSARWEGATCVSDLRTRRGPSRFSDVFQTI